MENTRPGNPDSKIAANDDENPSANTVGDQREARVVVVDGDDDGDRIRGTSTARTPFNNLSQVDADLALARTLQEQERAYMMLRMNAVGIDFGSWEAGSFDPEEDDEFDVPSEEDFDGFDAGGEEEEGYGEEEEEEEEEDAFDVHAHGESEDDNNRGAELDSSAFPSDEVYARALQDAEDQEMAARLLALAGINGMVVEEMDDTEDNGGDSRDTWEDVDPDELSYEELIALGEVVGTESRGLSADLIASLPSVKYKTESNKDGSVDTCVICRLDYEDGDTLTVLFCKHSYHSECITNWLQINKVCPVCSAEVSTSGNS